MNLNKVILIGRLTRDPESRSLPSGQNVSNFGMATNRVWTNSENEKQEQTEFHNIVAFGKLADICNQYLKKGSLAMIEGRIQTRSWQDQNGGTKYRTEIIAEALQLGPRTSQSGGDSDKEFKSKKAPTADEVPTEVEKIPEVQVDEEESENKESEEDEVKDEDIPF